MGKKCDQIMDCFLELDKNQRLPWSVSLHILFCKKCRTEIRLFSLAEKKCAEPLKVPLVGNDEIITLLMKKIDENYVEEGKIAHISMRKWIVSGILMILAMLVFLVSRPMFSNDALDLAFFILFACIVSAYCAIFVSSNIDFFVKKIETLKDGSNTLHIQI
ncbi:MAG: hypothetical protein J6B32_06090 [Spirochaetaceae bacterium]|nr:hypothetical protein [Spirochaetaceae bacterium]MBO5236660.1 hypothetical protein [Spirochaetaceae bacterium]